MSEPGYVQKLEALLRWKQPGAQNAGELLAAYAGQEQLMLYELGVHAGCSGWVFARDAMQHYALLEQCSDDVDQVVQEWFNASHTPASDSDPIGGCFARFYADMDSKYRTDYFSARIALVHLHVENRSSLDQWVALEEVDGQMASYKSCGYRQCREDWGRHYAEMLKRSAESIERWVTELYRKHAPEKISRVKAILEHTNYSGLQGHAQLKMDLLKMYDPPAHREVSTWSPAHPSPQCDAQLFHAAVAYLSHFVNDQDAQEQAAAVYQRHRRDPMKCCEEMITTYESEDVVKWWHSRGTQGKPQLFPPWRCSDYPKPHEDTSLGEPAVPPAGSLSAADVQFERPPLPSPPPAAGAADAGSTPAAPTAAGASVAPPPATPPATPPAAPPATPPATPPVALPAAPPLPPQADSEAWTRRLAAPLPPAHAEDYSAAAAAGWVLLPPHAPDGLPETSGPVLLTCSGRPPPEDPAALPEPLEDVMELYEPLAVGALRSATRMVWQQRFVRASAAGLHWYAGRSRADTIKHIGSRVLAADTAVLAPPVDRTGLPAAEQKQVSASAAKCFAVHFKRPAHRVWFRVRDVSTARRWAAFLSAAVDRLKATEAVVPPPPSQWKLYVGSALSALATARRVAAAARAEAEAAAVLQAAAAAERARLRTELEWAEGRAAPEARRLERLDRRVRAAEAELRKTRRAVTAERGRLQSADDEQQRLRLQREEQVQLARDCLEQSRDRVAELRQQLQKVEKQRHQAQEFAASLFQSWRRREDYEAAAKAALRHAPRPRHPFLDRGFPARGPSPLAGLPEPDVPDLSPRRQTPPPPPPPPPASPPADEAPREQP